MLEFRNQTNPRNLWHRTKFCDTHFLILVVSFPKMQFHKFLDNLFSVQRWAIKNYYPVFFLKKKLLVSVIECFFQFRLKIEEKICNFFVDFLGQFWNFLNESKNRFKSFSYDFCSSVVWYSGSSRLSKCDSRILKKFSIFQIKLNPILIIR